VTETLTVLEPLFLAVEDVIPADHPAAILAVPLGLLFFGGSIFLLLWSNYGAKKGAAIYGTAFFAIGTIFGVFWWLGGPGIPTSLGVTHLPGQTQSNYQPQFFAFEQGSERAEFFPSTNDPDSFQDVVTFLGREGLDEEALNRDPLYAETVGAVDQSVGVMQDQYLPLDENGVAQIGAERRQALEDEVAELVDNEPELEDARRAPEFYTAEPVGDPRVTEDPEAGLLVVTQRYQTVANFVDAEGVPILMDIPDADEDAGEPTEGPWPVGEETDWFAFQDPGAVWFPSMLWTLISIAGFGLSLFALDRLEMADKRRAADVVEEPEDLAVPIAQ
jgi:hypothetical protein